MSYRPLRLAVLSSSVRPEPPVSSGYTYRYFRFRITDNNGSAYTAIQEIELRSLNAGADVTSPSTPASSSSNFPGNDASKVVDNDTTTFTSGAWVAAESSTFPHYVSVDLGSPTTILEFSILAQAYTEGLNRAPRNFLFQGSSNNSSWNTLLTVTGENDWAVGVPKIYALPVASPLPHRYWRIVKVQVAGSFLEPSELQLLGGGTPRTATLTSSDVPTFGSVSDLNDGNLTTRCYWTGAVAEASTFWIKFDLGSAFVVDGFRQGGYDEAGRHMDAFTMQYSDDDSTWVSYSFQSGLPYPGNFTLSPIIPL